MNFSLRTKILLLTAGATATLALVILAVLGAIASRQISADQRARVRTTDSLIRRVLSLNTQAFEREGTLIADEPVLRAVIGTGDHATIVDTAKDLRTRLGCDAVVVTDRDGVVLANTDSGVSDSSAATLPGIKLAAQGQLWSGVTRYADRVSLAVTVPVLNGPTLWGTFTILRNVNSAMAADIHDVLGTDLAFVENGRVIGSSLTLPAKIETSRTTPLVDKFGGIRYYTLYGPMPGTDPAAGVGFVTFRPYDEAVAEFHVYQLAFISVSLLAFIAALGVGRIVSKGFTSPIEGLVIAARQLQRGEWPNRINGGRTDEIGLLQDVFDEMASSVRQGREELEALIDTDPLTKLDNHRRFQERLLQEAAECDRYAIDLTVVLLDIDQFQSYNQQYGHAAGDEILRQAGETLRASLTVPLARYAGDKFAVLLPHVGTNDAASQCERVRVAIKEALATDGRRDITLSAGYAVYHVHSEEPDGLVLAAELALARAKQLGRNQACGFDNVSGGDATADPSQLQRYLKDGSLATIQALAAAVDAKDPYTKGHSESVARYAVMLAEYLGMSSDEVELIYVTGTLHDVGKIGVPDAILKKPGRLEPEEREIMQTHPVLGEVIVRKAPQLAATIPGVRNHHERWDGMGYPDRLAGLDIPKIARLLAVADSFDAMTSDRPYRKGMDWSIALGEIEKGIGSQFDPEFGAAFVTLMKQRLESARSEVAVAA